MGLKMERECFPPWTEATLSSPNTTGKVFALLGECMIAGLFRICFNACGSETTRRSSYGAISFLRVQWNLALPYPKTTFNSINRAVLFMPSKLVVAVIFRED
jgi:hypothetical protein